MLTVMMLIVVVAVVTVAVSLRHYSSPFYHLTVTNFPCLELVYCHDLAMADQYWMTEAWRVCQV
jgi:hypothetical protein